MGSLGQLGAYSQLHGMEVLEAQNWGALWLWFGSAGRCVSVAGVHSCVTRFSASVEDVFLRLQRTCS